MKTSERGQLILEEARALFEEFKSESSAPGSEAIGALRAKARSAMDWLEDTEGFEEAHRLLDEIGAFVRRVRPEACELIYEDETYFQACPVALAHTRVGLSPTFIVREAECSVCRTDPWECEHILGEMYDGRVAHVVITRADLIEVSLVARPRQPDARITRASISLKDLVDQQGAPHPPGTRISCDNCLSACPGVVDSFGKTARGSGGPAAVRDR